jgi:sulfhydrogenase subunit alpha
MLGDRLEGEAGKMYEKYYKPHWTTNPFYHTPARSLEIMYSFERIPALVDEILEIKENSSVVDYSLKNGKGTGLVEAPRGLLIHHHEITGGLVSAVDIITPTAQNAEDIERYCHTAAQKLLDDGKEDQIRDRMDMVVRAFDPCISCSAHMVEVHKVPEDNWKNQLENVAALGNPVFVGVGNEKLSDDGVGIELARRLRKGGVKDVVLESEIENDETLWIFENNRPILFLDAVNFQQAPGKVTVLPMNLVLNNAALSHRFLPIVSGMLNYNQLKNAYVVGIQPESIGEGNSISDSVVQAMELLLDFLLV